jgi:hypothetical protein
MAAVEVPLVCVAAPCGAAEAELPKIADMMSPKMLIGALLKLKLDQSYSMLFRQPRMFVKHDDSRRVADL